MRSRLKIKARLAYCNGCDLTFFKMHSMMNHRRTFRCGGVYLEYDRRDMIDYFRLQREERLRAFRAVIDGRTEVLIF